MQGFDLEEERIKQEIVKLGAKRVLLQMPEGLKPQAPIIAKALEQIGALVIISADPCYGACDIAAGEAESLSVDLVIHFGHAKFVERESVRTFYVEARASIAIDAAILAVLPLLKDFKKIGLLTSVQHLQMLNQAKELLIRAGKTIVVGNSGQNVYAGQVTGCNYSNAKTVAGQVEAFVFVGGGTFHALGIALSTSKPTFIADPYDKRAFKVNGAAQKIVKQRFACIQESKKAETFGAFVGLKQGQRHLEKALKVKELAEKHSRSVLLFAAREITPDTLLEFPTIDAYVNTACPRISMDAPEKFQKPVLTVNEFRVVLGEISWESLLKKGLFEN